MYRLYQKSEMAFAMVGIAIYSVAFGLSNRLSDAVGIPRSVTALTGIALVALALAFTGRHGLRERYGLVPFRGNLGRFLFFVPLALIASVNLWTGLSVDEPVGEVILFVISMACVGFLEELVFRGFLFKAVCDAGGVRIATAVSSASFGLAHLGNLLAGSDLVPTLLQVCYAIALGYLFTIIFREGGSLVPCITAHAVINASNAFAADSPSPEYDMVVAAFLCVASVAYALWISHVSSRDDEGGDDKQVDGIA